MQKIFALQNLGCHITRNYLYITEGREYGLLTAHLCFLPINSVFVSFSCNLELTSLLLLSVINDARALHYLNNQNTLDSIFFGFHQCCK